MLRSWYEREYVKKNVNLFFVDHEEGKNCFDFDFDMMMMNMMVRGFFYFGLM
jgi:hypothetical protein